MKIIFFAISLLSVSACVKDTVDPSSIVTGNNVIKYTVAAGQQAFQPADYSSPVLSNTLSFNGTFLPNTNYTLAETDNHAQVSKMYGFTDCGDTVLENSARFGWEVINGNLSIFDFRQINGVITYDESHPMAVLNFGQQYYFQIQAVSNTDASTNVTTNSYIFTIKTSQNGTVIATATDARACASGAKFINTPYFGGTVAAPHAMEIDIQVL
jgi:hypothetical protein